MCLAASTPLGLVLERQSSQAKDGFVESKKVSIVFRAELTAGDERAARLLRSALWLIYALGIMFQLGHLRPPTNPAQMTSPGPSRASPGGSGAWMIRLLGPLTLQLSKNIRCFSNMRRLPSSASSSDTAISERWPVSSACFTITRCRRIWTANSAICRLASTAFLIRLATRISVGRRSKP